MKLRGRREHRWSTARLADVEGDDAMRFGYWMPVFGGWLRNVEDEQMEATWAYVRDLAVKSERWGYDLSLIAELHMNDIKGIGAPALDAWSTAGGVGRRDHVTGADGGGAAQLSSTGAVREDGGERGRHRRWPARTQRSVELVGR